jgi:hypothetical protein
VLLPQLIIWCTKLLDTILQACHCGSGHARLRIVDVALIAVRPDACWYL